MYTICTMKEFSHIEKQLIEAIKASGLTLTRLAEISNVSEGMISRFVNGKRGITLTTTAKICDVLGLELRPKGTKKGKKTKK